MNLRMPSINKVIISGNLTDNPRTNILENGTNVTSFQIANNQRYKGKDGEWHDKTCFVSVVTWRQLAERLSTRLHKGSPVIVDGELQYTQWNAQDGTKRSRIEINARYVQVLEKAGDSSVPGSHDASFDQPPRTEESAPGYDDDIPF